MLALLSASLLPPAQGAPETVPYIVLMVIGFLIGAWGHAARANLAIAVGIAIVVLAIVLFQLQVSGGNGSLPAGPFG